MISRILLPTSASLAAFGAAATAAARRRASMARQRAGHSLRHGRGNGRGDRRRHRARRGLGAGATLATGASCSGGRGMDDRLGRCFGARRAGQRLGDGRRIDARCRRGAAGFAAGSGRVALAAGASGVRIRGASPAHRPRPATGRGNGCRRRSDRPSTTAWACCPACCSRARPDCGAWNGSDFAARRKRWSKLSGSAPARCRPENQIECRVGRCACYAYSTRSGPDRDAATPASRCNAGHFQLNARGVHELSD